jgi:hypothetical protein
MYFLEEHNTIKICMRILKGMPMIPSPVPDIFISFSRRNGKRSDYREITKQISALLKTPPDTSHLQSPKSHVPQNYHNNTNNNNNAHNSSNDDDSNNNNNIGNDNSNDILGNHNRNHHIEIVDDNNIAVGNGSQDAQN